METKSRTDAGDRRSGPVMGPLFVINGSLAGLGTLYIATSSLALVVVGAAVIVAVTFIYAVVWR